MRHNARFIEDACRTHFRSTSTHTHTSNVGLLLSVFMDTCEQVMAFFHIHFCLFVVALQRCANFVFIWIYVYEHLDSGRLGKRLCRAHECTQVCCVLRVSSIGSHKKMAFIEFTEMSVCALVWICDFVFGRWKWTVFRTMFWVE